MVRVRSWRVSIRPRCSASIDRQGRYAYGQQPAMAQWNLARLAEALLPVLDARDIDVVERVEQVVAGFAVRFDRHWTGQLRAKLGLAAEEPDDRALADDFLQLLQREKVDFTLAFRLPVRRHHGAGCRTARPVRTGAPGALGLAGALAPAHGPGGKDLCRTAPQRRGRSIPS